MQWLKHICAVVLVLCLVLPFAGTWSWLQYEQVQVRKLVKKQIISGMDQEDLCLLTFSLRDSEDLDWHHSAEFAYEGEMYDVVHRESCGDSVSFWCWKDVKETALRQQVELLAQSFGQGVPVTNTPGQHLLQYIKNVFCQADAHSSHHRPLALARIVSPANGYRSVPGNAPPTPPPDFV
jgi:hypothetical protein